MFSWKLILKSEQRHIWYRYIHVQGTSCLCVIKGSPDNKPSCMVTNYRQRIRTVVVFQFSIGLLCHSLVPVSYYHNMTDGWMVTTHWTSYGYLS